MKATVSGLFRYPVKSMIGETCSALTLDQVGTVGDRVWAVRDETRGGIRGGKKIPSLMTLSAAFIDPSAADGSSHATITAPDGQSCVTGAGDINEWLSQQLDHPVTLWPLLPADALDHYRRGAPDSEDLEQELREVFGRAPDEPLPDLEIFAEVLEYESPPGTYFDAFPLLIMSEQSLASMAAYRPESQFDVSRFRPNILVNCEDSENPYPEEEWIGKHIRLGDTLLEVIAQCPRCSMTTHGFADLPKDPGIMRALVQANGGNLGVYAKVLAGGSIAKGNPVQF
jgi:uncharacterized protein YcbX